MAKIISVLKIEEFDGWTVQLDSGNYMIDGVVHMVKLGDKIQVSDIHDIRTVTRKNIVMSYRNGPEEMTKEEFVSEKYRLLSKQNADGGWDSLEDEFAYRKFQEVWTPVEANCMSVGDPLLVTKEVKTMKLDTGSEFITSQYLESDTGKPDIYVYARAAALAHYTRQRFDQLGMTFEGGAGYEYTKNRKVWTNSTHSNIRYVAAFGKYLFNDSVKQSVCQGTLEIMKAKEKADREYIEQTIQTAYNERFGRIDEENFPFEQLKEELYELERSLNNVEPKVKTISSYRNAKSKLRDAITLIKN